MRKVERLSLRTFCGVGSESVSTSPGLGESPSNTRAIRLTSGVLEEAGLIDTVKAKNYKHNC